MNFYDELERTRRMNEAFAEQAKRHEMNADALRVGYEHQKEIENTQLRAATDLQELRMQYEQSQKEQAKENRLNRIFNVVAILIAAASMVISLVK